MKQRLKTYWANKDLLAYILLILATFCWASVFIIGKDVVASLPAIATATLRFVMAGLAWILILVFFAREAFTWRIIKLASLPAFLGIFAYNIAFFYGLDLSYATHGVLIVPGLGPAMTALISFLFLHSHIRARQVIGIGISFIGMVILVIGGIEFGEDWQDILWGDVIFLGCTLTWSLYTLRIKSIMNENISPLALTGMATILGALAYCLMSVILYWPLTPILNMITMTHLMQGVYMGLIGTCFAFLCWSMAIKQIGPVRTTIFLNFVPAWGVLLALIFLDEPFSLYTPLSFIMILAGVYLTQRRDPKKAPKLTPL